MKILLAFLLLISFHSVAFASPGVSSVSSGVVSGSDFGTKSTARPQYWDTFEDGSVDTTATIGTWDSVNSLTASTSNLRTGTTNANHDFGNTGAYASVRCGDTPLSIYWYVSYWVYLASDWDWGTSTYDGGSSNLSNVKCFRLWNPGDETENFYTQFRFGIDSGSYSFPEHVTDAEDISYDTPAKEDITTGEWHRLDFQFSDSLTAGAEDATYKAWFDGTLVETRTGFEARSNANLKRPFIIGFYSAWGQQAGEPDTAPNNYYMDDIYADSTWARVEVGNNATYDSCNHKEMQIPTAWSDTSISVTYNQGSFTNYETAYLFVIDSTGTASDGYQGYFLDNTFYPSSTGPVASASSISGAYSITGACNLT